MRMEWDKRREREREREGGGGGGRGGYPMNWASHPGGVEILKVPSTTESGDKDWPN